MSPQGLLLAAVTAGVLMVAIYLTSNIIENENGGISAAVRTIGACLAIWALVQPRAGLYIISVEAFSLDFIKKIAVYYGAVNTGTVIEVLIVGILAVVGTLLGTLAQSVAFRRYKIKPLLWATLGVALLAATAVFLASEKIAGFVKAGENSFNSCVYIAIALPMSLLLTDREQLYKLLNLQFFLASAWALCGIKQYFLGFSNMEWFYAETGLSAVATDHMIRVGDTRVFGFGSGMPNFTVISPYFCYGAWYIWQRPRHRFLFTVCTFVLFCGVLASLQRTILVLPALVLVFYYLLRSLRRTIIAYATGLTLFLLAVFNVDYLLQHVADINNAISVDGYWGQNMLNIGTYEARLTSWRHLTDPATYSLFGLPYSFDTAHDVITETLSNYGVVGAGLAFVIITYGLWFVQRLVLRVADPQDRKFAIFLLAATIPNLATGIIGGGNFTANPVNLQVWSFFGVCIALVANAELAPAVVVQRATRKALESLQVQAAAPRVPMAARAQQARQLEATSV